MRSMDPAIVRALRGARSGSDLTSLLASGGVGRTQSGNSSCEPGTRSSTLSALGLVDSSTSRAADLREVWDQHGWRGVLQQILHGRNFELFMCAVVVANSLVLGIEQGFRLRQVELSFYTQLEAVFMAIYITELCMHFAAYGLRCLRSRWVRFELLLVIVGGVSDWIIIPYFGQISGDRLSSLTLLRTARLLRLARAIRLIVKLREIRMLVLGLASSITKMLPTMGLGAILLYVLGCVAVELIPLAMLSRTDLTPQVAEIIKDDFGSLPGTMFTLLQFLTFDNAVLVYKPLVEQDGSLSIFFVFALLLLGVIFMNLITATMISRGLEQAMEEKIMRSAVTEARRRGLLLDLEKAFNAADTDRSGSLSREEVAAIDKEQRRLLQDVFGIDSLVQYYDCLDIDKNGELGIDEFCHGLEGIILAQVPLEVKHVERVCQAIFRTVRDSYKLQRRIALSMEGMAANMDEVMKHTLHVQGASLTSLGSNPNPGPSPGLGVGPGPGPGPGLGLRPDLGQAEKLCEKFETFERLGKLWGPGKSPVHPGFTRQPPAHPGPADFSDSPCLSQCQSQSPSPATSASPPRSPIPPPPSARLRPLEAPTSFMPMPMPMRSPSPLDHGHGHGNGDGDADGKAASIAWVSDLRAELLEWKELCLFNMRQALEEASASLVNRMTEGNADAGAVAVTRLEAGAVAGPGLGPGLGLGPVAGAGAGTGTGTGTGARMGFACSAWSKGPAHFPWALEEANRPKGDWVPLNSGSSVTQSHSLPMSQSFSRGSEGSLRRGGRRGEPQNRDFRDGVQPPAMPRAPVTPRQPQAEAQAHRQKVTGEEQPKPQTQSRSADPAPELGRLDCV